MTMWSEGERELGRGGKREQESKRQEREAREQESHALPFLPSYWSSFVGYVLARLPCLASVGEDVPSLSET